MVSLVCEGQGSSVVGGGGLVWQQVWVPGTADGGGGGYSSTGLQNI